MSRRAATVGERRLLSGAATGEVTDLSDLTDEERVVSAETVRSLCVDSNAKGVDPRGVRLKGAHITAPLDLAYCAVATPLQFEATTFDAVADLTGAHLPALGFIDSVLPGLVVAGVAVEHDLVLDGSTVAGVVQATRAKVGGNFSCHGATLSTAGGTVLIAELAEVSGGFLLGGFRASGAVLLDGVRISGGLDCSGARLANSALSADSAEIGTGISLAWADVTGTVRLARAHVGGPLVCSGATLSCKGGYALYADDAEIAGDVELDQGFSATGSVSLVGARIRGQLNCRGARLRNKGGYAALLADEAEIDGDVVLDQGFRAGATIRLPAARIGRGLSLSAAALTNGRGDAFVADEAEIRGDLLLDQGFGAKGAVRLSRAKVGGRIACQGAVFKSLRGDALVLDGTAIAGSLSFRDVEVTGGVTLSRASAATLDDDLGAPGDQPLGSWYGVAPLVLDDFAYSRFGPESSWDWKLRKQWLQQTSAFQPGAWQRLIEVYRAQGRAEEATQAAIAMQNDRVARGHLPRYRRVGRYVLRVVVGHGYRPWLAGIWALGIIAGFALAVANWSGMFVAAKKGMTGAPQPIAYAADTFLPIVDLGQTSIWTAVGWMRWVDWSVVLLGWALTTIFVAGFTRIVRSE